MIMSNKIYDVISFIQKICLPAMASLYAALASIWNFPYSEAIVGTGAAIMTFLGAFLEYSKSKYNNYTVEEAEE